ncbi:MAG TPA: BON domain-containing protein [Terracidiphilus sp.]|nr:BON domain-containing protein [Terracidiphilus sp.]
MNRYSLKSWAWTGAVLLVLVVGVAGCRQQPARTDQQIATDVQTKIKSESALATQNIQVSVANGVATLSGTVTDEASRALAGNDSGTVDGVKTVVNNLTVQPQQAAQAEPAPAQPEPEPAPRKSHPGEDKASRHQRAQAPPEPVEPAPSAPPTQETQVQPPPPPPPPPQVIVKQVTLPAGTEIPVRITETLDSKTAQPNDVFHGSVASDLGTRGVIAIPQGTPVNGRIVDAKEAAHFKGNALLTLELTWLQLRGQKITLVTDNYSKTGAGRGANTAKKAGGGALFGTLIGALAGGGKGAAIGALAGAAAGTGVNAATRGEQAVIPTETLVNFHLESPLTMTVTMPPQGDPLQDQQEPQLQQRQP